MLPFCVKRQKVLPSNFNENLQKTALNPRFPHPNRSFSPPKSEATGRGKRPPPITRPTSKPHKQRHTSNATSNATSKPHKPPHKQASQTNATNKRHPPEQSLRQQKKSPPRKISHPRARLYHTFFVPLPHQSFRVYYPVN